MKKKLMICPNCDNSSLRISLITKLVITCEECNEELQVPRNGTIKAREGKLYIYEG